MKRSGTTVLWETLRQDRRNLCFDEPFHPSLWQGKRSNGKGTWTEMGAVFDEVSRPFGASLRPIRPLDELTNHSDAVQRCYLHSLMQQPERTVIDEVRLWNRMPEILPDDIPVVIVHLLRDPINWVTSQMFPSNSHPNGSSLSRIFGELTFFRRRSRYNAWRYEEIAEAALAMNHPMFHFIPDAGRSGGGLQAFKKLIALWWAANLATRARLSARHNCVVINVSLSEFSAQPAKVIWRIYAAAGWELPRSLIDFSHVRPIRPSWKPGSSRWRHAFAELGLPAILAEERQLDGEAMTEILDENLP